MELPSKLCCARVLSNIWLSTADVSLCPHVPPFPMSPYAHHVSHALKSLFILFAKTPHPSQSEVVHDHLHKFNPDFFPTTLPEKIKLNEPAICLIGQNQRYCQLTKIVTFLDNWLSIRVEGGPRSCVQFQPRSSSRGNISNARRFTVLSICSSGILSTFLYPLWILFVVGCMSSKSLNMSSKSPDIRINVHNEVLSDAKS